MNQHAQYPDVGQRGQSAVILPFAGRQVQTTQPIGAATLPGGLEKPRPIAVANAILPVLPEPLTLFHGPLLVTLQWWADGTVVADLPICALSGEGDTDTGALEDLGSVMLDWAVGVKSLGDPNLGGALARQWAAFNALVDVTRL